MPLRMATCSQPLWKGWGEGIALSRGNQEEQRHTRKGRRVQAQGLPLLGKRKAAEDCEFGRRNCRAYYFSTPWRERYLEGNVKKEPHHILMGKERTADLISHHTHWDPRVRVSRTPE